jgi:hypothetical protein
LRLQGIRNKKKQRFMMIGIIITSAVTIVLLSQYLYVIQTAFGAKEIYPTKQGGREWYFDINDPFHDEIFDPGTKITKLQDGSWLVGEDGNGNYQVRMNVITLPGQNEWRDVEITGYVKVTDRAYDDDRDNNDDDDDDDESSPDAAITWYARGGRHSDSVPCEGTSLKGILHIHGLAAWQKEIWHTGGYTKTRAAIDASDTILDKWIGWKVVMYNINNNTAVKMESYIDENADNNWRKVTELVDSGTWYADYPDSVFNSVDCNRPKDYVITNSGPIVTFRSDNIVWQFKELSVREIDAL